MCRDTDSELLIQLPLRLNFLRPRDDEISRSATKDLWGHVTRGVGVVKSSSKLLLIDVSWRTPSGQTEPTPGKDSTADCEKTQLEASAHRVGSEVKYKDRPRFGGGNEGEAPEWWQLRL